MRSRIHAAGLAIGAALALTNAATAAPAAPFLQRVAQAMVPPTGMDDASKPMPMQERMQRRFPQPVRVGDLIGLRVLDDGDSTIGFVRQVVRTAQNKIELVVAYGGWFGWGARLVAVPIEVIGIEGRQLASLDMPRSEYATELTWQASDATVLGDDATIRVALARH
jgi:PRC-barrel domain protein